MATNRGWITADTTCPTCSETNKVNVYGGNGDVISKPIKCAADDVLYTAEITLTFSAAVTNHLHDTV